MKDDISRVRDTSATARRADNIREIVALMRNSLMTFAGIQEVLRMSPSGTRKYVRELITSDVIMIDHTDTIPRIAGKGAEQTVHYFRLTDDEAKITRLMGMLSAPRTEKKKGDPRKPTLTGDPSRHFHIMMDDTHYAVKPQSKLPAPDPLLAAFFGMGGTA